MQNPNNKGFTLIELLIVVVIIGILAAIAIPKFSATRERAFISSMKADLKNLSTQQEIYYADPANAYNYAPDLATLTTATDYSPSDDVTVAIAEGDADGWSATATHPGVPAETCAIYVGAAASVGDATVPGLVTCTSDITP